MDKATHDRLEYLRGEIRAERISMNEIDELQSLADEIDPGDVELLEWAGVPEFPEERAQHTPEPWKAIPYGQTISIRSMAPDCWDVVQVNPGGNYDAGIPSRKTRANAERIVACVNGCAGIHDPENSVPKMLAALETALRWLTRSYSSGMTKSEIENHRRERDDTIASLRAAIARATGGE